jgi:hypothetical protein
VLELGAVRFRFLTPQGTHTLEELPGETPEALARSPERKSLFVLAVLGLLVLVGAGAILVTLPETPSVIQDLEPAETVLPVAAAPVAEEATGTRHEPDSSDEPQEWEALLARAQSKLAHGHIDAAYEIANELPTDSVLRGTPEFGEIRYRYAQAHILAGDKALRVGDAELAKKQAKLVLALKGTTSKQRRDAKRLLNQARQPSREPSPSPEEALAQAHQCVASGDNACVIRALEGGRARSPAALALLIETYRAMDDLPAARRHMRAFVARYPDDPRTSRYRRMLGAE